MASRTPLTTAQVPPEFLAPADLIGCTPFKALAPDSRLSYCLYVPPAHYNPDPSHAASSLTPSHPSYNLPRIPLIVTIHGTERDPAAFRHRLIALADSERVAILAPLFPAGLDDEYDLNSYKLLRSKTLRSDLALLDMVSEVSVRYPGINCERFYLIGFSGGGQFVQRFLFVHPHRIISASIGSPGRITKMNRDLKWPRGVGNLSEVFGAEISWERNLEALKIVKVHMVVGGDDRNVPSADFNEWQAKMKGLEPGAESLGQMTTTRVNTLQGMHEDWRSLGMNTTFEIVQGVKHDANGVNPAVESFLRLRIGELWSTRGG